MTFSYIPLRRSSRALLVAIVAGTSACGVRGDAQPTAAAHPGIDTHPVVLQDSISSSNEAGVVLQPPGPVHPRISDADARLAARQVFGAEIDDMVPTLATLTKEGMGIRDRLVWAFIGRDLCSSDSAIGPYPGDAAPTTTIEVTPGLRCIGMVIIDATSGDYLLAYSEAENARELVPDDVRASR